MDTLPFYVFLFVHLISLVTGFGAVIVIDTFGLCWLLSLFGVDIVLVKRVANITQRLIWLGFVGLIVSGIPMLVLKGHVDALTQVKLFMVLMVGLNGVFLHLIKKQMDSVVKDTDVTPKLMFKISFASFISQFGWWSALTIGFLHRHWKHTIPWPAHSWQIILPALVLVCCVGFGMYTVFTNVGKRNA